MSKNSDLKVAYFGTPQFAVSILDELKKAGIIPALVVTAPDKPQGRGLTLTPPPVKVWADQEGIDVMQPNTLKDDQVKEMFENTEWDVFVVAAYGKILPSWVLDLPRKGVLNVHPSLLPRFRGPSPIESAILEDEKETGVSIMLLDEEVDHGPVLAQASIEIEEWPLRARDLEKVLAEEGGKLLAEALPLWVKGEIDAEEQNHELATFTKKIEKKDGELNLKEDPYQNFLKIQAYDEWPGTFFFQKNGNKEIRVKITDAYFEDGELTITKVIPEGKKEMAYQDFLKGITN